MPKLFDMARTTNLELLKKMKDIQEQEEKALLKRREMAKKAKENKI